jgi:hypothetical protein
VNKIVLILAVFFAAICYPALAETDELRIQAAENTLIMDSGDLNISGLYSSDIYGIAETVKFKPPKSTWTLEKVQIVGWDGYVENETQPEELIFCVEIRDQDLKLLYRYTDSQLAYFNYPGPVVSEIEVPSLIVKGDFYVCFYDRGAVGVGYEFTESGESSYWYNRITGELLQSKVRIDANQDPVPINWYIRAVGS